MDWKARAALAGACCAAILGAASVRAAAVGDATVAFADASEQKAEVEVARFRDAALTSSDLRLRAMVGSMPDEIARDGWGPTDSRVDALIESARGSTDPMVLAVLVDACGRERPATQPTCDALDLATRWTVADTQNQLAWLTLSSVLRRRGDETGSRVAFERAAQASMWHEFMDDAARIVAGAIPKDTSPQGRLGLLQLAFKVSMRFVFMDAVHNLTLHCKDPTLLRACVRIVDTVARDGGSLASRLVALRVAEKVGVDPVTVASRKRSLEALMGASVANALGDVEITNATERMQLIRQWQRRVDLGELPHLRAMLVASGLSEAASADRYRDQVAALVAQARAAQAAAGPKPRY